MEPELKLFVVHELNGATHDIWISSEGKLGDLKDKIEDATLVLDREQLLTYLGAPLANDDFPLSVFGVNPNHIHLRRRFTITLTKGPDNLYAGRLVVNNGMTVEEVKHLSQSFVFTNPPNARYCLNLEDEELDDSLTLEAAHVDHDSTLNFGICWI